VTGSDCPTIQILGYRKKSNNVPIREFSSNNTKLGELEEFHYEEILG